MKCQGCFLTLHNLNVKDRETSDNTGVESFHENAMEEAVRSKEKGTRWS